MMVPALVLAFIYIILVLMITMLVKILENIFARSDRKRNDQSKKGGVANA